MNPLDCLSHETIGHIQSFLDKPTFKKCTLLSRDWCIVVTQQMFAKKYGELTIAVNKVIKALDEAEHIETKNMLSEIQGSIQVHSNKISQFSNEYFKGGPFSIDDDFLTVKLLEQGISRLTGEMIAIANNCLKTLSIEKDNFEGRVRTFLEAEKFDEVPGIVKIISNRLRCYKAIQAFIGTYREEEVIEEEVVDAIDQKQNSYSRALQAVVTAFLKIGELDKAFEAANAIPHNRFSCVVPLQAVVTAFLKIGELDKAFEVANTVPGKFFRSEALQAVSEARQSRAL